MTQYVIFEQLTGGRAYLASFADTPDNASPVPYVWTPRRREAMRLPRTNALLCATSLEEAIRANGYTPGRIEVQPASGGQCCYRDQGKAKSSLLLNALKAGSQWPAGV